MSLAGQQRRRSPTLRHVTTPRDFPNIVNSVCGTTSAAVLAYAYVSRASNLMGPHSSRCPARAPRPKCKRGGADVTRLRPYFRPLLS